MIQPALPRGKRAETSDSPRGSAHDRLEDVTGRAAIVTGATSGIGTAIARRLSQQGMAVALTGRNGAAGDALRAQLGSAASFVELDLTEADGPAHLVAHCRERFGRIDVLVNNAGLDHTGDLLDVSREEARRIFETNVMAPLAVMQESVRWMEPGGAIVNVTSRLASVGVSTMGVYGASKGALLTLTLHAAVEFAPRGIRVNAVAPGMTKTPLYDSWLSAQEDPNLTARDVVGRIPLGRIALPEEVAAAVAFLVSPESSHITGVSLAVDGGYTAV